MRLVIQRIRIQQALSYYSKYYNCQIYKIIVSLIDQMKEQQYPHYFMPQNIHEQNQIDGRMEAEGNQPQSDQRLNNGQIIAKKQDQKPYWKESIYYLRKGNLFTKLLEVRAKCMHSLQPLPEKGVFQFKFIAKSTGQFSFGIAPQYVCYDCLFVEHNLPGSVFLTSFHTNHHLNITNHFKIINISIEQYSSEGVVSNVHKFIIQHQKGKQKLVINIEGKGNSNSTLLHFQPQDEGCMIVSMTTKMVTFMKKKNRQIFRKVIDFPQSFKNERIYPFVQVNGIGAMFEIVKT